MAIKDEDNGQFLELEVTSPEGKTYSNYSYLRMGAWESGTLGAEAQTIASLGDEAIGNPDDASKLQALTAKLSASDAANLQSLREDCATKGLVASSAKRTYSAAKAAFDAADAQYNESNEALSDLNQAEAALGEAHKSLEEAEAALATATAAERNQAEKDRDQAKAARAQAQAAYDARKTGDAQRINERTQAQRARAAKLDALTAATNTLTNEYPGYKKAQKKFEDAISAATNAAIQELVTAAPEGKKDRGEDLAAMVTSFFDDPRYRGPNAPSEATRQQETKVLHTKGGWRDHSEGNRITTTRGDKVEVINGNYRLLVLGRQDEPASGAVWEAGGGLFQDNDIAPGAISEIKWEEKYGGTWMVTEETLRGDQISRYHGDVTEEYFGEKVTTTVGSEAGGKVPWEGDGETRVNPKVVERTWAESIDSQTGSAARRVPSIKDVTWADQIKEETHANAIRELTQVEHGIVSTTAVGAGIVESTIVGASHLEFSVTGTHIETSASAMHVQLEGALLAVEAFAGAVKIEMAAGKHIELNTQVDELDGQVNELKGQVTTLLGLEAKLTGPTSKIHAAETTLTALSQRVDGQETHLTNMKNALCATVSVDVAVMHNLI